jgi:hypothetical protein
VAEENLGKLVQIGQRGCFLSIEDCDLWVNGKSNDLAICRDNSVSNLENRGGWIVDFMYRYISHPPPRLPILSKRKDTNGGIQHISN